jgi:hypothetical protein
MIRKKTAGSAPRISSKRANLPATQGMLQAVRTELKADIRGLRSEMKAGFSQVDAKFNTMDSKIEQVLSAVARIGATVEEQNARNQVVMEGLTVLFHRQDRTEVRLGEVENVVHGLAARSRR